MKTNDHKQNGSNPEIPARFVETTFHVRYAETDQMGIVHHSAYVVWLEEGRSQWMRTHGSSVVQFEQDGLQLAVSEISLRYHQPAHYDQQVTVRCGVTGVRSRQIQFKYDVVDTETGTTLVTGCTQHVCLDNAGNVTKIPDKWRLFLCQDLLVTTLSPTC
jgi:acyl-CoA thioester hydrolase